MKKKKREEPIIQCIAGEDIRTGDYLYFNPKNGRVYKYTNKEQYRLEPQFDILEREGHLIKKVKLKEISLVKNKKCRVHDKE